MEQPLLTVEQLQALHSSEPTKPEPQPEAPKPQFQRPTAPVNPASEKQIAFLKSLVAERYPQATDEYVEGVIAQGSKRVSQAIDSLLTRPKVAQPSLKRQVLDSIARPNQYGGRCDTCQQKVEPMEGTVQKGDDGKWHVEHKAGQCPANEFPFPLGRYAVEAEDGHLAFYVTTVDGLYVQASDDLHRVAVNAQQAIIAKIALDPQGASTRYGKELGQCGRCGKTLTSEWRLEGIGPICAQKDWA